MDLGWTASANVDDLAADSAGTIPLRALLALSSDGFFFVASDASVSAWSEAAASTCGIDRQRALHADVRQLFLKGETIVAVPFDGTAHEVQVAIPNTGDARWLRASVAGVSVDARTHGWLCSFGPERRYREIEQLKNEIVATVSHELKTPIASVKAYAITLRDNPEFDAQRRGEFLRVIEEQADRLSRAVDDLLAASRVDVEQMLRHRVPIVLDEVLDAALCVLLIGEADHPILRRGTGIVVSGDPELLRDVFFQFLDNAAKFSQAGTPIEIAASNDDRESIIEVSDRGIGIADEHVPYIFERFYRGEQGVSAQIGGNGLGLFLAQALVRAHGGTISVKGRPGGGTTFITRLPRR